MIQVLPRGAPTDEPSSLVRLLVMHPAPQSRSHRTARGAVVLSAAAFAFLEVDAWPDRAECMAPEIFRIALPLGVGLWCCAAIYLVGAWVYAGRDRLGAAIVFLVAAHLAARMALERVLRWDPGGDRWHAVHRHGPWALRETPAGDREAAVAKLALRAFARGW